MLDDIERITSECIDSAELTDKQLCFTYDTGNLPSLQIGHRFEFELTEPADDLVIIVEGMTWQHDAQGRRLILDGDQVCGNIQNIIAMLRACPFVSDITTRKEQDL